MHACFFLCSRRLGRSRRSSKKIEKVTLSERHCYRHTPVMAINGTVLRWNREGSACRSQTVIKVSLSFSSISCPLSRRTVDLVHCKAKTSGVDAWTHGLLLLDALLDELVVCAARPGVVAILCIAGIGLTFMTTLKGRSAGSSNLNFGSFGDECGVDKLMAFLPAFGFG